VPIVLEFFVGGSMQVNYRLTEEDYIEYNVHRLRSNGTLRKEMRKQRIVVPMILMPSSVVIGITTHMPIWYWLLVMFVASFFWYLFFPLTFEKKMRKKLKEKLTDGLHKDMLADKSLTTYDFGIMIESEYKNTKLRWRNFKKITETDQLLFLHADKKEAFIVPKRAFTSKEEMNYLKQAVEERLKR